MSRPEAPNDTINPRYLMSTDNESSTPMASHDKALWAVREASRRAGKRLYVPKSTVEVRRRPAQEKP